VIKSYKDLVAWQKAMDLVELVYDLTRGDLTRGSPREELFGLATPMEVAKRLGYINDEQHGIFASLASDTGKTVNGLMNSMERYAVAHGR
jgi:hypothetical protein